MTVNKDGELISSCQELGLVEGLKVAIKGYDANPYGDGSTLHVICSGGDTC